MKRKIKYIKVKDGVISLLETDDFNEAIKDAFGDYYAYDSSDYIFDENLDIRVFIEAGSEFLDYKDSIYYEYEGAIVGRLKGTVLIAKNGLNKWQSLSSNDIKLILKKLKPHDNNSFIIHYPRHDSHDWLYKIFEKLDTSSY